MTRIELARQELAIYRAERDSQSGDYWAGFLAAALEMLLADPDGDL